MHPWRRASNPVQQFLVILLDSCQDFFYALCNLSAEPPLLCPSSPDIPPPKAVLPHVVRLSSCAEGFLRFAHLQLMVLSTPQRQTRHYPCRYEEPETGLAPANLLRVIGLACTPGNLKKSLTTISPSLYSWPPHSMPSSHLPSSRSHGRGARHANGLQAHVSRS